MASNWSGAILLWLATNEAEAEDTPVEVLLLDVLATQLTVVPTTDLGPGKVPILSTVILGQIIK